MTTEKKVRTPRNLDSIRAGALKLELQDRVQLAKDLKASIDNEVTALQAQAENAKKIAGGGNG